MEDILKGLDDTRLWRWLAGRMERAYIIAPDEVLQRIFVRAAKPRFSYGSDLRIPTSPGLNIFVWDLDPADLALARAIHPKCQVYGIIRDIWSSIVTGGKVLSAEPRIAEPTQNYMIVCAPRSGSEFLCGLLTEAGLGRPREHIREAFIQLYRSGVAFAELMQWVTARGTENGYFGTKLISHFLYSLRTNGLPLSALRQYLQQADFRIVVLSRDPAEQAISSYFAHQTGVWHLRGAETAATKHENIPYNSEVIHQEYHFLCAASRQITEFTEHLTAVFPVEYKELDSDPQATLRKVAAFIGVSGAARFHIECPRLTKKISDRHQRMQEYLNRFRGELESKESATEP